MIRAYRPDDLPAVLEAWYQASLIAHHFLTQDFFAQEREDIADRWLPMAETWVYEDEGSVVGFISLVDDEVGAIFVHPDQQGRGVGRALMDWARDRRPHLELDVFEANQVGRRFYDAYGCEQVGRSVHEPTGQAQLRLRLPGRGNGSQNLRTRSRGGPGFRPPPVAGGHRPRPRARRSLRP